MGGTAAQGLSPPPARVAPPSRLALPRLAWRHLPSPEARGGAISGPSLQMGEYRGHDSRGSECGSALMCVGIILKVTHMKKTQVYLREDELDALRLAAARSGRSVAALVRDAI